MKAKTKRAIKAKISSLTGVRKNHLVATVVRSRTAAMRALQDGASVIVASSKSGGAIHVWRDDSGQFRVEFQRYCLSQASATFKYLASVDQWLRNWWPRMVEET